MKLKEINSKEFTELIIKLPVEKILDFYSFYDEIEDEGIGVYSVEKLNWLDNNIILIGGYEQPTKCLDITHQEKQELNDLVLDFIESYFDSELSRDIAFIEVINNI